MNLSFAGCGFMGIYHVGVAVCFRKYAPHLLLNRISGASAGALAACGLLCDLPIGDFTSDVLRVATEARSRSLGPLHPNFNVQKLLIDGLDKFLPEDAHLRVSGKLHISLTRVYDGKNVIVSQFNSKEELISALGASCFIPVYSGLLPPKFQGVRYMDGGFSDNLPTLDENTITVSPFCGESDICPRDDSMQLFHINIANTSIELSKHNAYRFMRILFPPKPEILSNICKQGFDDALRFLHRNNLINCTRCLAVQSTFVIQETIQESMDYDPQCNECKMHRQEALVSNLPDTVLTIFQEAIDSANNGLVNWIFKHRGMKLLSVLSLPYTLPADVMYATFTNILGDSIEKRNFQYKVVGNVLVTAGDHSSKHLLNDKRFMANTPSVGNKLWDLSKYFLDQLTAIMNKVNAKRQQLTAKISCQVAVTEYTDELPCTESKEVDVASTMNLNFTFNLDEKKGEGVEKSDEDKMNLTTRILSRRSSLTINTDYSIGEDTFENILQVTTHNEALMSYYYLDENNKVKVTEIFDVTESDSPTVQGVREREINSQLEFDDDWDGNWSGGSDHHHNYQFLSVEDRSKSLAEISEYSINDATSLSHDKEYAALFSDPESEWAGTLHVEEPEDDEETALRPESEQDSIPPYRSSTYQIPSFTYNDYNV